MCLGQASWDWWSDVTRKMIYSLVGGGGGWHLGPLRERGLEGDKAGTCRSLSLLMATQCET